jgi:hypothetical protein
MPAMKATTTMAATEIFFLTLMDALGSNGKIDVVLDRTAADDTRPLLARRSGRTPCIAGA